VAVVTDLVTRSFPALLTATMLACAASSPRIESAAPEPALRQLPGTLTITVSDREQTFAYALTGGAIVPAQRSVCAVPEVVPAFAPGDDELTCPCAASAGDEWIAAGARPHGEYAVVAYDVVILRGAPPRQSVVRITRPRTEYIGAIAWSPDGELLAVLSVEERTSKSPLSLLGALAGHPTPLHSFRVQVYRRDGQLAGSTAYIRGFVAARGSLCWSP
jgi:hypothetical protein